ncbi:hypothetical protein Q7P37_001526 [Cladosporium fusiforme]
MARSKKLVVLCDGTWCGRETGTETNIWLLGRAFGIELNQGREDSDNTEIKARYFTGCGLGRSFLYYLFDGATGSDLREECVKVYQYIIDQYDKQEIWMFGLSRGAFTVRCVAGMIKNCGIVNRKSVQGRPTLEISEEVYDIYRSPHEEDHPKSEKMARFRERFANSEHEQPLHPVKFMGLFDTVGSLGIPRLNPGVTEGGEWPEFHDQKVSSVVEKVYHAVSLHDRLWIFQPCRASRDPKHIVNKNLVIKEIWLPGCHYDLGRQQFELLRESRLNSIERHIANMLRPWTTSVVPNPALANLALNWMLRNIIDESKDETLVSHDAAVNAIQGQPSWPLTKDMFDKFLGSGDVYSDLSLYLPGARGIIGRLFRWIAALIPGVQSLSKVVLATRDRRVSCSNHKPDRAPEAEYLSDDGALALGGLMIQTEVFNYKRFRPGGPEAAENLEESKLFRSKYPSRTQEMHARYCTADHA